MATSYSISTIPFASDAISPKQLWEVTGWLVTNGYNWPLKLAEKDAAMIAMVKKFGSSILDTYSASQIV